MGRPWYRWQEEDLLLNVQVQPRAARDEVVGPHGDCLKVRITAPPVEGKANTHLRKFLAKLFKVSPGAVTLEGGESARNKHLRIHRPRHLPEACAIDE